MFQLEAHDILRKLKLPKSMEFYSVGGQIVFPIRGADGSLKSTYISYIIFSKPKNKFYPKYAIEYDLTNLTHNELNKLLIKSLTEFKINLKNKTARTYDPDGGDLGRGDNLLSQ